jgi:hypothetical protein
MVQLKPSMCARFMVNQNHLCVQGSWSTKTIYGKVHGQPKPSVCEVCGQPKPSMSARFVVQEKTIYVKGSCQSKPLVSKVCGQLETTWCDG